MSDRGGTCKDCKHWNTPDTAWYRALEGDRRVLTVLEERGFRVCSLSVTGIDEKDDPTMPDRPLHEASLALAQGDEGIALMRTSPNFSCSQFEKADEIPW